MRKDGKNYMLTATLVENSRVDGKIQQKHILQLGSISTRWGHVPKPGVSAGQSFGTTEYKQASFWLDALDRMHFAGISPMVQEKTCEGIALKVPRPNEEDLQAHRKSRLAYVRQYYKPEYVAQYETWCQRCGL